MAEEYTPNLNLLKPDVGGSTDTWGDSLNGDMDILDALFDTGPLLARESGGTGTDLSLTGGSGHVLKQVTLDGPITSGKVSPTDLASVVPLSMGGTGAATQAAAANAVLPSQASNSGKLLATDGSNVSWSNNATLTRVKETTTVSATAATGTVNFDVVTQPVLYYTTNAAANWTLNVRGDGSTSLDSLMSAGQSITVTFAVTNGSTGYKHSAMTIDGSSVTPKWLGGTAPATGNANSVDMYCFTIVKTGAATFTVFGAFNKFA